VNNLLKAGSECWWMVAGENLPIAKESFLRMGGRIEKHRISKGLGDFHGTPQVITPQWSNLLSTVM
jgi:hypothetical protein